jgi:hypothetical protein
MLAHSGMVRYRAGMKVALIVLAAGLSLALPSSLFADDKIGVVQKVAPNVYFHQGDLDKGHCNQG